MDQEKSKEKLIKSKTEVVEDFEDLSPDRILLKHKINKDVHVTEKEFYDFIKTSQIEVDKSAHHHEESIKLDEINPDSCEAKEDLSVKHTLALHLLNLHYNASDGDVKHVEVNNSKVDKAANLVDDDEIKSSEIIDDPSWESDVPDEPVIKAKSVKCKGCDKLFTLFLKHVNSKNFKRCKKFYDDEELEKYFEEAREKRKKSYKKYRQTEGAKEKEKEHKKKYLQTKGVKQKEKEHQKKYRQTKVAKEKEKEYKQKYRQLEGNKEKEREYKRKYRQRQGLKKSKKSMLENIIKRLEKVIKRKK